MNCAAHEHIAPASPPREQSEGLKMDNVLNWLTPHFYYWAAIISSAGSLIAFIAMVRNELKRSARSELKRVLARHHFEQGSVIEDRLAHDVARALLDQRYDKIRNMKTDVILEDYILDIDFKRRLYFALINELKNGNKAISNDVLRPVLEAVQEWKDHETDLPNVIDMGMLSERSARLAIRFLENKEKFFERKRDELVADVSAAVEAAVAAPAKPQVSRPDVQELLASG